MAENLYYVQDNDRPMHVIAESWQRAIEKWKAFIAIENKILVDDVGEPLGITLVDTWDDLIL